MSHAHKDATPHTAHTHSHKEYNVHAYLDLALEDWEEREDLDREQDEREHVLVRLEARAQ